MKLQWLFAFISIFLSTSCYHFSYINSVPSAPMLSSNQEGQINIFPGLNHFEFQGAYSPIDDLGITASNFWGFDGSFSGELSALCYMPLDKNRRFLWDFGVGIGVANIYDSKPEPLGVFNISTQLE